MEFGDVIALTDVIGTIIMAVLIYRLAMRLTEIVESLSDK